METSESHSSPLRSSRSTGEAFDLSALFVRMVLVKLGFTLVYTFLVHCVNEMRAESGLRYPSWSSKDERSRLIGLVEDDGDNLWPVLLRYVMITSNSVYTRIYKPHWIACMIAFSWLFSFLMQLPTLTGIWGESSTI